MSLEYFLPESANHLRRLFRRLDPDSASVWEAHVTRLTDRGHLDPSTRYLVTTAQYTVTERHAPLAETLGSALDHEVPVRHLLEVILQAYVYTGPWVVAAAAEVLDEVVEAKGVDLPSMPERRDRNLESERMSWSDRDRTDPRTDGYLARYG